MREIKFRGKGAITNNWFIGSLITFKDGAMIYSDNYLSQGAVKPETIGQYTGVKDKNGKEIYEGDILHIKQYENNGYRMFGSDVSFPNCFTLDECKGKLLREGNGLVYFTEGSMCVEDMYISALFGDMRYSFPLFEFEIIGNIHDNPELIKEKEK